MVDEEDVPSNQDGQVTADEILAGRERIERVLVPMRQTSTASPDSDSLDTVRPGRDPHARIRARRLGWPAPSPAFMVEHNRSTGAWANPFNR